MASEEPPHQSKRQKKNMKQQKRQKGRRPSRSTEQLWKAVRSCDFGGIQKALANGASLSAVDDSASRWTALHWAASRGDVKCIRKLMDYGANVNARDVENRRPLQIAQERHYNKSVKVLGGQQYALHLLDLKRELLKAPVQRIELLVSRKADINMQNEVSGKTILHRAAEMNRLDLAKLLLRHGAIPNIRDESGRTPIYDALGNTEMVKLFLQHGATVANIKDKKDKSIIIVAAIDNHTDVLPLLVEHGATLTKMCVAILESHHFNAHGPKKILQRPRFEEFISSSKVSRSRSRKRSKEYVFGTSPPALLPNLDYMGPLFPQETGSSGSMRAPCAGVRMVADWWQSMRIIRNAYKIFREWQDNVDGTPSRTSSKPLSFKDLFSEPFDPDMHKRKSVASFPRSPGKSSRSPSAKRTMGDDSKLVSATKTWRGRAIIADTFRFGFAAMCSWNAQVLMEQVGASMVGVRDTCGSTALHCFAEEGDLPRVQTLISRGAAVNHQDCNGDTALHLAAGNGHYDVVEYLLFPECKAHCRQMVGYTLLMCFRRLEASCGIGFRTSFFTIHVLDMLFTDCGANPFTENRLGMTAYDVALRKMPHTAAMTYTNALEFTIAMTDHDLACGYMQCVQLLHDYNKARPSDHIKSERKSAPSHSISAAPASLRETDSSSDSDLSSEANANTQQSWICPSCLLENAATSQECGCCYSPAPSLGSTHATSPAHRSSASGSSSRAKSRSRKNTQRSHQYRYRKFYRHTVQDPRRDALPDSDQVPNLW